jgi:hypothetical protein
MTILYNININNPSYEKYDIFPEEVWTSEWYTKFKEETIQNKNPIQQHCFFIFFDDMLSMNAWLQENKIPAELQTIFNNWKLQHNIIVTEKFIELSDIIPENTIF